MAKTLNLQLNLEENGETKFEVWRKSIDGNNLDGEKSNMQILDEVIGKLQKALGITNEDLKKYKFDVEESIKNTNDSIELVKKDYTSKVEFSAKNEEIQETITQVITDSKKYTDDSVKSILGDDVEEAYDTFKEIQDLLKADETQTADIIANLNKNTSDLEELDNKICGIEEELDNKADKEYVDDIVINNNPSILVFKPLTSSMSTVTIKNLTGVLSIDWGDGTETKANGTKNFTHSYEYGFTKSYTCKIYGATEFGLEAFYANTALSEIEFSKNITFIGANCFKNCTSLNLVKLSNLSMITASAFYGCTVLTSIIIPDSVTSILNQAFYGCTELRSVILPKNLKSIGASAFQNTKLANISIPVGVTSMGSSAFYGTNISQVTFEADTPRIATFNSSWFPNELSKIYVPTVVAVTAYKKQWTNVADLIDTLASMKELENKVNKEDLAPIIITPTSTYGECAYAYTQAITYGRMVSYELQDGIGVMLSIINANHEAESLTASAYYNKNGNVYYCGVTIYPAFESVEHFNELVADPKDIQQQVDNKADKEYVDEQISKVETVKGDTGRGIASIMQSGGTFIVIYTDGTRQEIVMEQDYQFYWEVEENGLKVEGILPPGFELEITEDFDGMELTGIAVGGFYGQGGLVKVTIAVPYISQEAFYDCETLNDVTLTNKVTGIGENAFGGSTPAGTSGSPIKVTYPHIQYNVTINRFAFGYNSDGSPRKGYFIDQTGDIGEWDGEQINWNY